MSSQTLEIPAHDLPYWMRQAQRGWDWGLVLVAFLSLLAAWPFVSITDLPRTNAAENYVFMTADYSDSLREGRLYPRWSPNAFNGYGAPIPNYFPPGAPYSAALIKVLFTNDAVLAVRIVFVLAHIIAGMSLYAFVRRCTTASAGLLAAVLFLYSPYFGNVAPFIRGDLSEYLALALVPLLLLTTDRLSRDNQPFDLLFSAFVTAAILVTHPWIALAGIVLALLHTLPRRWPQTALALLLGTGLSAFFWLPALLEHDLVQWIERPATNMLTLTGLFASFRAVDLGQLLPDTQLTLGRAIIAFTILAAVGLLLTRKHLQFALHFLLAGTLLVALAVTQFPHAVWLLGLISLCLSIASGTMMTLQKRLPATWQRPFPAAILTIALMLSLPVLLVPRWPPTFGAIRPIDQIRYEQQGDGIAVLPARWPIPSLPTASLPPNRFLLSGYQSGTIEKIAPTQASNRTQISLLRHETHQERYQVVSDFRAELDLLTSYFPGWQATLGDQPISLRPDEQTGLINIELPPANNQLTITFGPTRVRQTAWVVTWGALGALLFITRRRARHAPEPPPDTDLLPLPETRLTGVVLVAFALIAIVLTNPASPITLYNRPGYALRDSVSLGARTSVGLEALAYSLESRRFYPGDDLDFTLYWQAIRTLPANYQTQAYLIEDGSGTRWHRTPLHIPGAYPTNRWRTYQYVTDHYTIPLSETILPGKYQIAIEVLDCNTLCNDSKRLGFFDSNGTYIGQTLILPESILIAP